MAGGNAEGEGVAGRAVGKGVVDGGESKYDGVVE